MKGILNALGIEENNFGAYIAAGNWSTTTNAGVLESVNPATGQVIANVYQCSEDDYEIIISESLKAFEEWQMVPAPIRGQLVREMGEELRRKKDMLGSLVALEMGKIKAEGDGEVQEMIDIADFAVGLSRQLYGISFFRRSSSPISRTNCPLIGAGTICHSSKAFSDSLIIVS